MRGRGDVAEKSAAGEPKKKGPQRVFVVSLGCPKNRVDTEYVMAALAQDGFAFVADEDEADLILINTCAFIEDATQESVDTILELAQLKKPLFVMGCLVQRYRERLRELLPEVAGFFGPVPPEVVVRGLKDFRGGKKPPVILAPPHLIPRGTPPRVLSTPRPFAYLKIAEGCSRGCTFCLIPGIRGPFVSRPLGDLVAEARRLAQEGVEELVVVAQETTRWGRDLSPRRSLPELLFRLCEIPGFEWIRVLYLHPRGMDDELLEMLAGPGPLLPYFDLPFQHASGAVLKRMGRTGDGNTFLGLLKKIRERVKDPVFRTTLMVGFPGETEDDFDALLDFVGRARFHHLGAFKFSPEEGVGAANLPGQVHEMLKDARLKDLMELQRAVSREILSGYVGKRIWVAKEAADPGGRIFARAWFQAPEIDGQVFVEGAQDEPLGEFFEVEVKAALDYDLVAKIITSA